MNLFGDDDTATNKTEGAESSVMGESEEDAQDLLDKLMGGDDDEEELEG